jgi:ribosomal protein S18 acetylase RimI-like enzyme
MIEIREVSPEMVRPMRQAILRPTQSVDEMLWARDLDTDTRHFAAFDGPEIVGIVTAYPAAPPEDTSLTTAWQFRGMATAPEVRGSGIGKRLVQKCIDTSAAAGAPLLWCDARISALGFYEKLGFEKIGEPFEKPHAGPHWRMYRWQK